MEVCKLKQRLLFRGGEGIRIRDVDRRERPVGMFDDEIYLALLLPVVDLMVLFLEFQETRFSASFLSSSRNRNDTAVRRSRTGAT
ncbi:MULTISPECIES: hypothetical protein [unclassified Methanoculleus]|uniref:hypothetical protein n=2 Tax=Methanoculleus TaxID=45989 RepID=UPI0025D7574E|nr:MULTISPECIES: hypothetical protein [unclassified Methanoculleus]MDD2254126.1 hypothetical protein [Methanoculleus sp.]MDD2786943.1 hypothetical protein [Methanoculleus sp.]MDD3215861.1 hypothetical protein [Methanoculleus sp.]MDD4314230.1 hypothetical protein [Methanoculleus sp.]